MCPSVDNIGSSLPKDFYICINFYSHRIKNLNVDCVDYNRIKVYYQVRNHYHDGDHCQYHCWDRPLSGWNHCQDRDPFQDGDEHTDGQNQRTALKYN